MPGPQPSAVSVFSQTVTLTNAQIKALPVTPVVIVPATEVIDYVGIPTQLQIPIFAMVRSVIPVAYDNLNVSLTTNINLGSDNSFTFSGPLAGGALYQYDGSVAFYASPAQTGASFGSPVTAAFNNIKDSLYDNAIVLAVNNQGDGVFTQGDDENSLIVTVLYTTISV